MPRRTPSIGAIALLFVLVVALVSGDEEEGERAGRTAKDRPAKAQRDERPRPAPDAEQPHEAPRTARPARGGVHAPVVRVVDGDTIEVELDGAIEDVRYIGVDTPESVAPGQPVECFGKRAARFNAALVEGQTVRLSFDRERRDRYGRLLAYVHVGERFVNAELVRRGYARTLMIAPNESFAARFDRLARKAGSEGLGLWSACDP